MRKFGIFSSTIFISILLGGIYGIIHDQITYTISKEYFTKFKFLQFGLEPAWLGGNRQTVAAVGFLATWWVGLIIGIALACTGLIFKNHKQMRRAVLRSIILVFSIAMLTALIGFFYGKFHLTKTGVDWWLPANLVDKDSFIIVGSIHNFSYAGGLIGLLSSIAYMIYRHNLERPGEILLLP